ncbi:MFS-type transporter clz9-like [Ischnura elegans]|uniref:MFS-type transporter clz9-like n=1 Tax=Ischnura elegans TaxID=197161 RepID=UPI001ED86781|nr:MFS-type transporter clz9-like [Ischnura elegans]
MPRNWKRSTKKAHWTAKDVSNARADVEMGTSLRQAAKKYGIPFSTLQQRFMTQGMGDPRMGRKAVFTKEQEAEIVGNVKTLANMCYGLTPLQLRKLVFEYAEKVNLKHRFNKDNRLAGKDWLEGFLKRNPSVSVRKPEATSLNRIRGFNREEISLFFENLEKVMVRYRFPPCKIYNMDETGLTVVHETMKVIGPKGQKRIGAVTSGERGKTTTVICCMNAAGGYIPPMIIYARHRVTPNLEANGPTGALYACSVNGWTNEEVFFMWLKHYQKHAKASKDEPSLLILDNHGSHISLEGYTFCRENNIVMLSLPPHTSHRLQPLDVVFYGPLKRAFYKECDFQMKSRPGEPITMYKIAELFNRAYSNVATIAKGVSGFACTGIYPMNPNIFSDEDFPFDANNRI